MKKLIPLFIFVVIAGCGPLKKNTTTLKSKKADSVSQSVSEMAPAQMICKNGGDIRQISVLKAEDGGCEVQYKRASGSRVVADAKNDLSYCDKVAKKIQNNLVDAGFDCHAE